MDFFNDIFHNFALLEFYFLNMIYILLYIDFILSIFFQHSNILTRASHHWCLASNIVLVAQVITCIEFYLAKKRKIMICSQCAFSLIFIFAGMKWMKISISPCLKLSVITGIYYTDVTLASWRLKSTATRLLIQQFFLADIKEIIKAAHCWPFVRLIHQRLLVYLHKGPVMWKKTTCHNVFNVYDTAIITIRHRSHLKHTKPPHTPSR